MRKSQLKYKLQSQGFIYMYMYFFYCILLHMPRLFFDTVSLFFGY